MADLGPAARRPADLRRRGGGGGGRARARASGSPSGSGGGWRAADVFRSPAAPSTPRSELGEKLRLRSYDAVVGIGGGKTIDTAKWAAARYGMPMVSVATSLAHDGIASPVGLAGSRRRARLVRRAHPARGRGGPRLRRRRPARPDPSRHRGRDQQPQRVRRLGAGAPGARRADGRAGGDAGPYRRGGAAAPPGPLADDGFLDHAGGGADPGRDRDVGVRVVPAVLGRLPRDLPRAGHAAPGPAPTASRSGWGRCSAPGCAATSTDSPSRRVPAPARAPATAEPTWG